MTDQFSPVLSKETSASAAARVGKAKASFDAIRVDYPPQTAVVASLDEMRIAALGRSEHAPCGGAMLVAPHGCGKTESIVALRRILEALADEGCKPLLHVETAGAGTTDSLPTSILQALGAARPDVGTEKARWPRAIAEMRRCGVQIVVFDEFNRAARRPRMSRPIATAIREKIMDAGVAPVAFVGSEDAGSVLAQVPELMERLDDDIDLSPLRWDTRGDRALFLSFLADLDQAMVDEGILACLSGLTDEGIARPLWEASAGRVRRICKIVRAAMAVALHDRRASIDRADLAEAVDSYCIPRDFCSSNPFARKGVQ